MTHLKGARSYHSTQKPLNSPVAPPSVTRRFSTCIKDSSRAQICRMKSSSAAGDPSAIMYTEPSRMFCTEPCSPSRWAQSDTYCRYPTPCTLPVAIAVTRFISPELGRPCFKHWCFVQGVPPLLELAVSCDSTKKLNRPRDQDPVILLAAFASVKTALTG